MQKYNVNSWPTDGVHMPTYGMEIVNYYYMYLQFNTFKIIKNQK